MASRKKAPDHSTIVRFGSGFLDEGCEDCFYQTKHRLERGVDAGAIFKADEKNAAST